MTGEDQRVWKVGLVEITVISRVEDNAALVLPRPLNLQGYVVCPLGNLPRRTDNSCQERARPAAPAWPAGFVDDHLRDYGFLWSERARWPVSESPRAGLVRSERPRTNAERSFAGVIHQMSTTAPLPSGTTQKRCVRRPAIGSVSTRNILPASNWSTVKLTEPKALSRPLYLIPRPEAGAAALPRGAAHGTPTWRSQARERDQAADGDAAGGRPALEPRLCLRPADQRPALPRPGGGRRLHPRMPGADRRHFDLRPARSARAGRHHSPPRAASADDRQRQRHRADLERHSPGRTRPASAGTTSRRESRSRTASSSA